MTEAKAPADRTKTGQFAPGVSGNPTGKPKSAKDFEALCRERTPQAIARLMEIGRGRGVAAVKALQTIVAYGYGLPRANVTVSGGAPLDEGFRGAARAMLEAAVEEAERGAGARATVDQTVALPPADQQKASDSGVIDVVAEPVPAERCQGVAGGTPNGTEGGATP